MKNYYNVVIQNVATHDQMEVKVLANSPESARQLLEQTGFIVLNVKFLGEWNQVHSGLEFLTEG